MKDEPEINQHISSVDPDGQEDRFNVPGNKSAIVSALQYWHSIISFILSSPGNASLKVNV